jgi:hypothetical protein
MTEDWGVLLHVIDEGQGDGGFGGGKQSTDVFRSLTQPRLRLNYKLLGFYRLKFLL